MASEGLERLMDGKETAGKIIAEIASGVAAFSEVRRPPCLTVINVGDDPASKVYIRNKVRSAKRCGIDLNLSELPSDTPGDKLFAELDALNANPEIDGIIVQLPLPEHLDQQKVIERISPDKDVDGFHPFNLGRLASGKPTFIPCTPLGISVLLSRYGVPTAGRRVVIIGRSVIVGKPLSLLLSSKSDSGNATVTVCHSRTLDLTSITRDADILVAAVGKAEMISGEMVKEGAVVVDVGMNRVDDPSAKGGYRLTGDVDFDSVYPKVSLITPVPGGVGPMTVAMLMKNTLKAAMRGAGADDEGK